MIATNSAQKPPRGRSSCFRIRMFLMRPTRHYTRCIPHTSLHSCAQLHEFLYNWPKLSSPLTVGFWSADMNFGHAAGTTRSPNQETYEVQCIGKTTLIFLAYDRTSSHIGPEFFNRGAQAAALDSKILMVAKLLIETVHRETTQPI